ncbi:MAG: Bax inhibitor-1/YccA family protein [Jatrophihabitantaceae bacterium]
MAENPVIRKFGKQTGVDLKKTPSAGDLQKIYEQPAYAGPRTGQGYMTLDDVVQRTGAMLVVLLAAGAVSWQLVDTKVALPVLLVGAMGGLALGLFMAFTMKANAPLCLLYSAFEGAFLGAISHVFDSRYPGIVVQAITGTVMVAGGMLFVYKIGAIRVTPKFTRVVVGATIGVFGLMVVNLIAYLFTPNGLGLRSGGPLAVIFSLVCIGIAAMNLVMDFDMIERGIRNGAPKKFAWYASFGLMVTLVWLYLEILRLLGYLRN